MEEENSDSSILKTVKTSRKNLKAYALLRKIGDVVQYNVLCLLPAISFARCSFVTKDQWITSLLLVLHLSYSFCGLSGSFVQDDGWSWSPTSVTLNHHYAYGVPSPSLGFLPDFLNLRCSSNGLCQSFNDSNPAAKELRDLPHPNDYQGFEPAVVLPFEPSMLNMSANYQLISAVPWFGEQVVCFELYSSKTICLELGDAEFTGMKGIAYWQSTSKQVLASYMINESYEIISIPPPKTPRGGVFSEMHDELCYIDYDAYWLKIYCGVNLELKVCISLLLKSVYPVLPCADVSCGEFPYTRTT